MSHVSKQSTGNPSHKHRLQDVLKPIIGHWNHKPEQYPINSAERYKVLFNEAPICEIGGKEPAICFASFEGLSDWKFVGESTMGTESYAIAIIDFFARPASVVDWLAHMAGKPEMDWESFGAMMRRFRQATGSKGGEGPNFKPEK